MEKHVLAVDDDAVSLRFVERTLSPLGYEVTCANSAQEAIDMLKVQKFDCIILDFYMPGKDGLDVIGSMYSRQDRTPTIVLSAKLEEHYEAAVQGFGIVHEVLKKPCPAEKLLEAVGRIVNDG